MPTATLTLTDLSGNGDAQGSDGNDYLKVIGQNGGLLAEGAGSRFDYPSDGSVVHVDSVSRSGNNATLTGVVLLGGIVDVSQIDVFVCLRTTGHQAHALHRLTVFRGHAGSALRSQPG